MDSTHACFPPNDDAAAILSFYRHVLGGEFRSDDEGGGSGAVCRVTAARARPSAAPAQGDERPRATARVAEIIPAA